MKDDHQSMPEFVRELTDHQTALRSFVGYLMGGATGVQDVVQEVNLILWEKRGQYEAGTNFRAWAFATARFVVMGQRRKMKRSGLLFFDDELIERLADDWEEDDEDSERMLVALEDCLSSLPEKDFELLQKRYAGKGTLEQEARRQGANAGALRIRLFRLRAALKQCVLNELAPES